VNAKVRKQLQQRKRKLLKRISVIGGVWQSPMIRPSNTKLELAEKQQAVHCGGIAVINQLVKVIDLRKYINEAVSVLKLHLPYDEADHVLNIALNLLAGSFGSSKKTASSIKRRSRPTGPWWKPLERRRKASASTIKPSGISQSESA